MKVVDKLIPQEAILEELLGAVRDRHQIGIQSKKGVVKLEETSQLLSSQNELINKLRRIEDWFSQIRNLSI